MPRLRNPRSGVVVDVDDATAARLEASHEPVGGAKKAPAKKAAAKPAPDSK